MPILKDLKMEIEDVKEKLCKLIYNHSNHLTSDHIVQLSQELDQLIKKYYLA